MITGVLVKPHYVVTAVVLNVVVLSVVGRWLWRQRRAAPAWQQRVLPWALGLRLAVALLSGLRPSPDVGGFQAYSWVMTRQLWWFPLDWLHTLGSNEFLFADWKVVYYGMSNTFFFHKLLSVVNLLTLAIIPLSAFYLSLFCFIGGWRLVRAVGSLWPTAAPGFTMAFLLWPTVVFWTSTFTKESVLLGSGAWLVALVLELLYGPPSRSGWRVAGRLVGIMLLAALHFNMRFFFALPLLGGLAALGVVRTGQLLGLARGRGAQAAVLAVVLATGIWLAPQVSKTFQINKFTSQMVKVYAHHLSTSLDRPHFEYPGLVPTGESALRHMPWAIFNTVARPLPGQSAKPLYVAAGLENAVVLSLFALALVVAWRGKLAGRLPFALVLALGVYCLAVALLLGLTTPNLGTLNRYRSAMLPYLLALLLQNEYALALLRRLGLGPPSAPPSAPPALG